MMTHPDGKLASYVDEIIGYMADAQEEDGYLYTAWTARDKIDEPDKAGCRPVNAKWVEESNSHELYNLGHMYEAAAAHYEATGNKNFLNVSTKSADLLVETFGPGKMEVPPGHPEIELGLVKLYRATGNRKYLDLTRYLIEIRGKPTEDRPKLGRIQPRSQAAAGAGRSSRSRGTGSLLVRGRGRCGMLTGDASLIAAIDRLWDNVVGKKTYVTGGIGSTGHGEAFGKNYELPNRTAYCETRVNLATCMWNHRMFLLHGDAKYIDVLERCFTTA